MKKFQSVRGMKDILPNESKIFRSFENYLISLVSQFGYEEIRTPILEDTNLFIKSIGDGTDIVEKEMFSFIDSKNNSFSMRPEGTASCARAIIEHGLNDVVNRLWYSGPFFRHERPQKGRYRQFHQFGVELIGIENYKADFEIINIINTIWEDLNIKPTLKINNIGDILDRRKYIRALSDYLVKYKNEFNQNEKIKLIKNPLRLLDSKNENLKEIIQHAPNIDNYISSLAKKHFENLLISLDKKNILYVIDNKLVRGIDYYNRTVFEYIDEKRDTQNTLCAGGRYDSLYENMCSKKIPALGFAIGIERLMEYVDFKFNSKDFTNFYFIVMNDSDYLCSEDIANSIRKISKNYIVVVDYSSGNLKTKLQKANKILADYCVIIGENEIKNKVCQFKNMKTGDQKSITFENLDQHIRTEI